MNFAIVNLGCKVNRVESDAFASGLLARGCQETDEAAANIVVVNTCTVTGEAEKKTRKAVRHAHAFTAMAPGRVHVAGKLQVDEVLDQLVGPLESGYHALAVGNGFRTRVGVKVQDGCNNACTYCIVHVARGRATSRNAGDVREECKALAEAGVREIVLTGINLGSYRFDGGQGEVLMLDGLMQALLDDTVDVHEPGQPPCRFRISSIEPADVSDRLIDVMARSNGRICRHLHLPLQSGSTKVLAEMNRPYTAQQFEALVNKLYAKLPELSLSTDIICGFPGETDADFQETLDVAQRCRFSKIHVFPYSQREGTPAAARTDQVPHEMRAERARTLRALAKQLRQQDRENRAGTSELALIEENGVAMTESYHELPAPEGAKAGALMPVTL